MKRIFKFATLLSVILATVHCAIAFSGCVREVYTYEGEYFYTQYGTNYGIKVLVEVSDDRIADVWVLKSGYVDATPAQYGWTDEAKWNEELPALLDKFTGEKVEDVLNINVVCGEIGDPVGASQDNFSKYGEDNKYLISSCTVGSGRLIKAIQNAVKKHVN
ncbi:MAG: hypothetical protein J6B04_00745 [Clostridia bacterium]|nr:hypothetical protein [Clostridia bacterium]